MCDWIQRGLRNDVRGIVLDRRSFLRATAATTLTMAVAPSLLSSTAFAAGQEITIRASISS